MCHVVPRSAKWGRLVLRFPPGGGLFAFDPAHADPRRLQVRRGRIARSDYASELPDLHRATFRSYSGSSQGPYRRAPGAVNMERPESGDGRMGNSRRRSPWRRYSATVSALWRSTRTQRSGACVRSRRRNPMGRRTSTAVCAKKVGKLHRPGPHQDRRRTAILFDYRRFGKRQLLGQTVLRYALIQSQLNEWAAFFQRTVRLKKVSAINRIRRAELCSAYCIQDFAVQETRVIAVDDQDILVV